jgi:SprT-like family
MKTFQQYLIETPIELGDYSLENRYEHFNHLLFGGTLPKIPITWTKDLKHASGRVVARATDRWTQTPVPGTIRMEVNALFRSSEERLNGIMVHEMIHVYFFAIKNDGRESHGAGFKAKLAELQPKCDFTIPLTDDVTELEVDSGVRMSDVGVILKTDERGVWGGFIGKTAWQKYEPRIMANMMRRQVPGISYSFHFGKTNLHRKYKVYNDGTCGFFKLQPKEIETLQALPRVAVPATV